MPRVAVNWQCLDGSRHSEVRCGSPTFKQSLQVAGQVEEGAPCSAFASARGQGRIDHRVLDVGVPEPVLDETQVRTCLQQVGGNGVLEAVKVPLGKRQAGGLAVPLRPWRRLS